MSNQDYAPYIQRFLPSLTLEGVTSLNSELYSLSANREQLLETLATNVNTAYIKGTIGEPKPAEDTSKDGKDSKDKKKPKLPPPRLPPRLPVPSSATPRAAPP